MDRQDFNIVVEDRVAQIKGVLAKKAKEYSTDTDRLANFKTAAALTGLEPEQCAWLMMVKHIVSVQDMINDIAETGVVPAQSYVDEKCGDIINYPILIDALIRERREFEKTEVSPPIVEAIAKGPIHAGEAVQAAVLYKVGGPPELPLCANCFNISDCPYEKRRMEEVIYKCDSFARELDPVAEALDQKAEEHKSKGAICYTCRFVELDKCPYKAARASREQLSNLLECDTYMSIYSTEDDGGETD